MYNFDKVFDRHNTEVIKWDRMEKDFGRDDLIPLGIADMDFEVLPEIREALVARANHPTYGYTYASDNFYTAFINWQKKRNGFEISPEEMLTIPGIVCANSFILYSLTKPGDKVLLTTPVYDPFYKVIAQQGREEVRTSLKWDGSKYVIDFEDMERKMADGVKFLVLCSPHNPCGRVWTREELEKIDALCEKYNILVFSDEIHSDLVFPGHKHIPYAMVSDHAAQNSILAMAPSKTFNLAGLKSSILVSKNPEILAKVNEAIMAFHVGVNAFGFKATEVAYQYGAQWVDELLAYLYDNAKFVVNFVEQNLPNVKAFVPDGTYLMWLDFTAYGLTSEALLQKVIDAGVAPNDGSHYGSEGEGFLRINIGTQRSRLEEGMKRLQAAFAE